MPYEGTSLNRYIARSAREQDASHCDTENTRFAKGREVLKLFRWSSQTFFKCR